MVQVTTCIKVQSIYGKEGHKNLFLFNNKENFIISSKLGHKQNREERRKIHENKREQNCNLLQKQFLKSTQH